jgi:hypothetical protein
MKCCGCLSPRALPWAVPFQAVGLNGGNRYVSPEYLSPEYRRPRNITSRNIAPRNIEDFFQYRRFLSRSGHESLYQGVKAVQGSKFKVQSLYNAEPSSAECRKASAWVPECLRDGIFDCGLRNGRQTANGFEARSLVASLLGMTLLRQGFGGQAARGGNDCGFRIERRVRKNGWI